MTTDAGDKSKTEIKPRPLDVGDSAISGDEYLAEMLRDCIADPDADLVDVAEEHEEPVSKLPARAYYRLHMGASLLACETDDLIHFAALGLIRVGVKPPFLHAHVMAERGSRWLRHIFPSHSILTLTADDAARIEGYGVVEVTSFIETVVEYDRERRSHDVDVWYAIEKSNHFKVRPENLFILAEEVKRIESGSTGSHVGIRGGTREHGETKPKGAPVAASGSERTIPGKISPVGSNRLAIKAAWEIEQKTGRVATARAVMELLMRWATDGVEPAVLIEPSRNQIGVDWRTDDGIKKLFSLEACGKAIKKWQKSRGL